MCSEQVTAFDISVNSKYLLESNPTPSNIKVTISHVVNFPCEEYLPRPLNSELAFVGVLLRASAWYSIFALQIATNT